MAQCYGRCYEPQSAWLSGGATATIGRSIVALGENEVPRTTSVGTCFGCGECTDEQRRVQSGEKEVKCQIVQENRHFPTGTGPSGDGEIAVERLMRPPDCGW